MSLRFFSPFLPFLFITLLFHGVSISCTDLSNVVLKITAWLSIRTWPRTGPFHLHSSPPCGKPRLDLCIIHFRKPLLSAREQSQLHMFYYHINIAIALRLYGSCRDITHSLDSRNLS